MPQTRTSHTNGWLTMADVLHALGEVSPARIRIHPMPGKATEADLLRIQTHEDRLYELVDGTLVEKVLGMAQSCIASVLDRRLGTFVEEQDLGFVSLPDGPLRLLQGLVRLPNLAFFAWSKMPTMEYPRESITDLVPNLAVEVLSEGNTKGEMLRKRKEYFIAGVELVWIVDPYRCTVTVYTAPDACTTLEENATLDGGSVLPGFTLPLTQLFARVPRDLRRPARKKRD